MINLYIPVSIDCENFNIDDVEWIVRNKEEFIIPYIAMKEEYPLPTISIQLCDWYEYKDDTYISIEMMINLDNIDDFSLRVNEGYYCNTNNMIIDGDGFVDIKTDSESIQKAINDIKNKQIPLRNKVHTINTHDYPYVIEYDD
jgi:hypothetical protein